MSLMIVGSSMASPLPPALPVMLRVPGEPALPPPPPDSPAPTPVLRSPPAPPPSWPALAAPAVVPPGDPGRPPPGEIEKSPQRLTGGRLSRVAASEGATPMITPPLPSPADGIPLFETDTVLPSPEISPVARTSAGRTGEFACAIQESPRFIAAVALGDASAGALAVVITLYHWAGLELFALIGTGRCGWETDGSGRFIAVAGLASEGAAAFAITLRACAGLESFALK